MASAKFDEYKGYFDNGKWTKEMIHMATERGALTEAEYLSITGEEYVPIIYKWDGGNLAELSSKRLITGDPNATSNTSSNGSENTDSGNGTDSDSTNEEDEEGGTLFIPPKSNVGGNSGIPQSDPNEDPGE